MHKAGIFKSSVLVGLVNRAGIPLLAVYGICMFVYPFFDSRYSWTYVQDVWDRWQSLNAAALAFLASLIAFNIARYNENLQREREFVAAKAFLPSTFSGLMDYFSRSARIYVDLWASHDQPNAAPDYPKLPDDYREVFSSCIRHADPKVGTYLANIVALLQVHDARLRDLVAHSGNGQVRASMRRNLISYMYKLGELYALVAKQFEFARGAEPFNTTDLSWDNFRNAYGILRVRVDDISITPDSNLENFTRRALERVGEQPTDNDQG